MKLYRLIALVPTVALLGAGWFANRVEPRILGLPFLLAWIVGWLVATSGAMWLVYSLDRRNESR